MFIQFSTRGNEYAAYANTTLTPIRAFYFGDEKLHSDCLERLYQMLTGLTRVGDNAHYTLTDAAKRYLHATNLRGTELQTKAREIIGEATKTDACNTAEVKNFSLMLFDQPFDVNTEISVLAPVLIDGDLKSDVDPYPAYKTVKDAIMYDLLRVKFTQNPILIQQLLQSPYLIFDNVSGRLYKDLYWGCEVNDKGEIQETLVKNSEGVVIAQMKGLNKLGAMLTKLRGDFDRELTNGGIQIQTSLSEETARRLNIAFNPQHFIQGSLPKITHVELSILEANPECKLYLNRSTEDSFLRFANDSLEAVIISSDLISQPELSAEQTPLLLSADQVNPKLAQFYNFRPQISHGTHLREVVESDGKLDDNQIPQQDTVIIDFVNSTNGTGDTIAELTIRSPSYMKAMQNARDSHAYDAVYAEISNNATVKKVGLEGARVLFFPNCSISRNSEAELYTLIEADQRKSLHIIQFGQHVLQKPLTKQEIFEIENKLRIAINAAKFRGVSKLIFTPMVVVGTQSAYIHAQIAEAQKQIVEELCGNMDVVWMARNNNFSTSPFKVFSEIIKNDRRASEFETGSFIPRSVAPAAAPAPAAPVPAASAVAVAPVVQPQYQSFSSAENLLLLNFLIRQTRAEVKALVYKGANHTALRLFCCDREHTTRVRETICSTLGLATTHSRVVQLGQRSDNDHLALEKMAISTDDFPEYTGFLLQRTIKSGILFLSKEITQEELYLPQLIGYVHFAEKVRALGASLEISALLSSAYTDLLVAEREATEEVRVALQKFKKEVLHNDKIDSLTKFKQYIEGAHESSLKGDLGFKKAFEQGAVKAFYDNREAIANNALPAVASPLSLVS